MELINRKENYFFKPTTEFYKLETTDYSRRTFQALKLLIVTQ